ncbi:hypothetical protein BGM26_17300 [Bacillus sp. FJAT-29790]|uniref:hypothetical protein n=1 Tax=Bacillus sp. FJAT-29790 TaxID=1895002 RepID=UPI001C2250F3|nr:hypothetical protein [Bacillus sp. FJAT-29790]MBU8880712.1 hypothetical protein [Bacillus sp. FJAT-29790]
MIFLYNLLFLCFFINLIIDSASLSYVIGILALFAWLFSIKGASRLFKVISILFIIVGVFIFFGQQRSFTEIPLYMTSTISLLAVFFVLPFINSIIIVGRYDQQVNKLFKVRIQHLGQLFGRTSFAAFVLGGFLNIATLPLIKAVVDKSLVGQKETLKHKFISQAMLRGYTLSLVLSPMELLVVLTIEYTHVSYLTFLPWLVVFTGLLFIFNWIIGFKSYQRFPLEKTEGTEDLNGEMNAETKRFMIRKISSLLLYLLLFMLAIILINKTLSLGFMQTIAIIIIPFSFLWAISIKRLKSYITYSLPLWKNRTLGLKDNMALFLAVGFFTSNLNDSIFMSYIQEPFSILTETPILLFVCIQFLFLGLTMIGFHPLVTMSILGGVIDPIIHTLNPVSIGIVMISSALSTVMSGPFNISVSLTATLLNNINSYKISFWNLGFALLFSSIGTIIAICLL